MRLFLCLWAATVMLSAQSWELGLSTGRLRSPEAPAVTVAGRTFRNTSNRVNIAFQANPALKLRERLWLELPVMAAPSAQDAGPMGGGYASFFATPGLRLQLTRDHRLTPFAFAGGGYAWFERYAIQGVNQDSNVHHGAFSFGGGGDLRVNSWMKLRGEIRNRVVAGQHHTLLGGGFVLRLRK